LLIRDLNSSTYSAPKTDVINCFKSFTEMLFSYFQLAVGVLVSPCLAAITPLSPEVAIYAREPLPVNTEEENFRVIARALSDGGSNQTYGPYTYSLAKSWKDAILFKLYVQPLGIIVRLWDQLTKHL
jgi:hypothetical protein